jgi:hypothetical protein
LLRDPSERFDVSEKYPEVMADLLAAAADHQQSVNIKPPLFDRRLMPR